MKGCCSGCLLEAAVAGIALGIGIVVVLALAPHIVVELVP